MNKKWIGFTLAILVGAVILFLPTTHGLSALAHLVLAIAAFTVILWVFQVMNNGITAVLMMALMIFAGVKPALVLSGYSSPQFWILLVVLFYGFAVTCTCGATGAGGSAFLAHVRKYLDRDGRGHNVRPSVQRSPAFPPSEHLRHRRSRHPGDFGRLLETDPSVVTPCKKILSF